MNSKCLKNSLLKAMYQMLEGMGDPPSGDPARRAQVGYRDMATMRIFWGFCINRFGLGPLHYISSRSDIVFKFAEIFVIEKQLAESGNRQDCL
jgi:hypothetical protein